MVYILVLFGSAAVISALVVLHSAVRDRRTKRFVRDVSKRASRVSRGVLDERIIDRPKRSARSTAIEIKKTRELLLKAERATVKGDFRTAELAYIEALSTNQHSDDVRSELAKFYLKTGRNEKAEALYMELIQRSDHPSYWANLGSARYRMGKYVEACEAYAEALRKDPTNGERQLSYGYALYASQKFEEAEEMLEKARIQAARNVDLLRMLADCQRILGRYDKARDTYKQLHRLQPYDEEIKAKMASLAVA